MAYISDNVPRYPMQYTPHKSSLNLPETLQNRIDILQALLNGLSVFRARKHDLTVDEYQQHHARLHHAIDQTGKQLRFVRTELLVHLVQFLQPNREAQIDGGHQILHLELEEFHVVAELLDDASEFSSAQMGVTLVASSGANHLAGAEDQRRAARLTDAHDDAVKPGRIVFGVARAKVDLLQVEIAAEADGGHAVSARVNTTVSLWDIRVNDLVQQIY